MASSFDSLKLRFPIRQNGLVVLQIHESPRNDKEANWLPTFAYRTEVDSRVRVYTVPGRNRG